MKNDFFCTFQGSAATVYRWGGQIYNILLLNLLRISYTKNNKNRMVFDVTQMSQPMATFISQRLFSWKIRSLSLSFCHFGLCWVNTTWNNRLVGSYLLNKWAKFYAKIFTHFWEIAVFVLGRFILTHHGLLHHCGARKILIWLARLSLYNVIAFYVFTVCLFQYFVDAK